MLHNAIAIFLYFLFAISFYLSLIYAHAHNIRGQHERAVSLLLSGRFWRENSGSQTWHKMHLHINASWHHILLCFAFKYLIDDFDYVLLDLLSILQINLNPNISNLRVQVCLLSLVKYIVGNLHRVLNLIRTLTDILN